MKKLLVGVYMFLFMAFASPALASDSPPALPTLPPDEPTVGDRGSDDGGSSDTTAKVSSTASTKTATSSAAKTATSGPVETIALIGLAIVAFLSIKQYYQVKKYKL
ncbi:MAG TPA: hypothetical protein PLC05_02285 [bacterium]|nr:hypothetical protein [bacterium]HPL56311.1 hypothetical protein [bacterium]